MSFSPTDAYPMADPYSTAQPPNKDFVIDLTPEEKRIIKECAQEGIVKRAIPMGIFFGVGGVMLTKAGYLNHSKFGSKPAALGLGLLGYFIGRFSYNKVCIQRVLQVPDGTIRKMFPANRQFPGEAPLDPNSQFYATAETQKSEDTLFDTAVPSSDIDLASVRSFDTVPSDYYPTHQDDSNDQMPPQNYNSYDDLRKQNRDEFTSRYRVQPPSQQPPPRYPQYDRPAVRQDTQPSESGKQRTKYGDTWE